MTTADAKVELVAIALAKNDDKYRSTPFFMLPKTIQALFRSDAVAAITALNRAALEAPHGMTEAITREMIIAGTKESVIYAPNYVERIFTAMQAARPIDQQEKEI